MMDAIDFAFLDSGTGGIPYMLELKAKLPDARCVYLGDTEHFPYGQKGADEVTACAASVIRRIVDVWHPLALVVACNTISVTALDSLRALFPSLPIVGTVPAIRLAARCTRNKRIGLLATNATVRHPYCARLISDFASDCEVFSRGDPELIAFIERRLFTAGREERLAAVRPAVDFFARKGCDTIVLGCTHFTHIAGEFAFLAGPDVQVVDSRDGVAKQAIRVEREKLRALASLKDAPPPAAELPPDESFFVTSCESPAEREEYQSLCRGFHIPWGGVLEENKRGHAVQSID